MDPSPTSAPCVSSLLAVRSRDRGNVTCLGQAPVSEHKGRSQALRPHPDLDGYPQTRKWMQTTRDSGLMMLQRDGHLRVMSRREQCQDGSRNQNQNLQAPWPDRNATVTFGEETSRLHEQALGISTSYFTSGGIFPPHRASSHVGGEWLPCRKWNTEATSQKFLSIGLERRFNRNQHCPLF